MESVAKKSARRARGSRTLVEGVLYAEKSLLAPAHSPHIDYRFDLVNLLEPGACAAIGGGVLVGGLPQRMV